MWMMGVGYRSGDLCICEIRYPMSNVDWLLEADSPMISQPRSKHMVRRHPSEQWHRSGSPEMRVHDHSRRSLPPVSQHTETARA